MKAFYFGGSMIDYRSLEAAVLYYDTVIHYDVKKFFKPWSDDPSPLSSAINTFYKETKPFQDEEILRFIPINAWVDKYAAALNHLVDKHFPEFGQQDPALANITREAEIQRLIVIHFFGKSPIPEPYEVSPWRYGNCMSFVDDNKANEPSQDFIELSTQYRMPVSQSFYESDVIRAIGREVCYGLLGSIEFNATAFSDLKLYTQYFDRLLYKLIQVDQTYDALVKYNALDKHRLRTVRNVLKITVPTLGSLPAEEILEFRNKRKDELIAFRKSIDEIVDEINQSDLSNKTEEQLESLINSRLKTKISDLESTVEEKVTDMRKKRIENAVLLSVNLSGFAFLPFEATILPTILALAKLTTDEIGSLMERLRFKRNGLYFLWEFGKKQEKQ